MVGCLVWKTLSTNISSSIPPIHEGTEYIVDSKQKADLFNNFFASQAYVDDTGKSIPVSDYQQNQSYLTLIETTKEEVQVSIGSVNISKACGYDGIGNRILKICRFGIAKSFTKLINFSFLKGEYPSEWKKANVSPFIKKKIDNVK
jgi:hypothetical protein